VTETTSPPDADTDAALRRVIDGVELTDIRVVRWHGELRDYHAQQLSEFDPILSVDFRCDAETMQLRWAFDSTLSDLAGHAVADLGLTILQTFAFTEPNVSTYLDKSLIDDFISKTAVISVVPFVREAVQTMTVRLGLPAVTIGLARAG